MILAILNGQSTRFTPNPSTTRIPMNNLHLPSRVPAEARINYIAVLSSLENYRMPTDQNLSVEEIINRKIYAWYMQEHVGLHMQQDEVEWFVNYE
jgi:hypothetical protein